MASQINLKPYGGEMYHVKRIEIVLDDEDMAFVKWMAKRDGVSIPQELKQFFYVEFEQCKTLYMDEMREEME